MRFALVPTILLVFSFSGCNRQPEASQENFEYNELSYSGEEVREVLYSMYLPTDMSDIFARSGANYNPAIPAPVTNTALYTDHEQIAVMLGIYGVDITYMKLLEQTLPAAQYYNAIELLSGKINIPPTIFEESSRKLEQYFTNEDSLAQVIEGIYRKTDRFFKESGSDNLAALALVGGWIEALYIGVSVLETEPGNELLAERILQQKFSLNNIYTIISNYQETLAVRGYVLMLKKLRKIYDGVEIRYQKEGFSVDTSQKKFNTYNAYIKYNDATLTELMKVIPQIRNEIITPLEAQN